MADRYSDSPLIMPLAETGCWIWMGTLNSSGYGSHRRVYQRLRGPIPEGMTLDHTCRVRSCVNPDHLEPVSLSENQSRRAGPVEHGTRRMYERGCRQPCCQAAHNERMRNARARRRAK